MMKSLNILAAWLLISNAVIAQNYLIGDKESEVGFVIKNFGIKTKGNFSGLKGTIVFNPNALQASHFNVSVNSATINTDNSTRDGHLKKSEYFDVNKYPLISFESKQIVQGDVAGSYNVVGNLTIKGITKVIQFDFTAISVAGGFSFKGEFEINRRDFRVGGSSFSMSDNLKVMLNVAATP